MTISVGALPLRGALLIAADQRPAGGCLARAVAPIHLVHLTARPQLRLGQPLSLAGASAVGSAVSVAGSCERNALTTTATVPAITSSDSSPA